MFLWGKKREGARKREQKKDILKILKLQWGYAYPIFVLSDISLYNQRKRVCLCGIERNRRREKKRIRERDRENT